MLKACVELLPRRSKSTATSGAFHPWSKYCGRSIRPGPRAGLGISSQIAPIGCHSRASTGDTAPSSENVSSSTALFYVPTSRPSSGARTSRRRSPSIRPVRPAPWLYITASTDAPRLAGRGGTYGRAAASVLTPNSTIDGSAGSSSSAYGALHVPPKDELLRVRHYGLAFVGSKFVSWIIQLIICKLAIHAGEVGHSLLNETNDEEDDDSDADVERAGCVMKKLTGADCTDTYAVQEIHRWALTEYGPSCVRDI
ncbi:hypothetical protein DL766_002102 [Monosporascus sp. MC13-8B]|uniref:Uncharacterized protein n=1 Tax=Monosporascus cannonballus TaxID=155416 RepID=A0ABY0H5C4_9PEZI|nr:hypothetical protein DL762_006870 [Monosporascus cannonballus]RYO85444.1 hypothetical protein DL763_007080 [Monosporascus cannonballus]RYP36215.1 hypothetical protein DL766_002102 [Monosporascus sp. MC13-8B]